MAASFVDARIFEDLPWSCFCGHKGYQYNEAKTRKCKHFSQSKYTEYCIWSRHDMVENACDCNAPKGA